MNEPVMPALSLEDLDLQEKQLNDRLDAYVTEANQNIAAFRGAIQQVQAQRAFLQQKQKPQVEKKGRRQRGKVAKKETSVATEVVTAPEPLADVA